MDGGLQLGSNGYALHSHPAAASFSPGRGPLYVGDRVGDQSFKALRCGFQDGVE